MSASMTAPAAYVEVLDDERAPTVCGFLQRAVAWFAARGVIVQRLMTDNGNGYRSHQHRDLCRQLQIKHLFTEPYRPRANGKAERFIRTLTYELLRATGQPPDGRTAPATPTATTGRLALHAWLDRYNYTRPHRALGGRPPAQRLAEQNNAAGTYS